jgi:TolA-binding protein
MTDEELSEVRREMELPWPPLRERRLLERCLETQRTERRSRLDRRSTRRVAAVAVGLAAAAAVVLGVILAGRGGPTGTTPTAQGDPRATTPREAREGSRLALPDGSTALLSAGAEVEVERHAPEEIVLSQRMGSVRYDVVRNPARSFVVDAADLRVRVVGTEFVVSVDETRVRIEVLEGIVRVEQADRRVPLGAGEVLELRTEAPTARTAAPEPVEATDVTPTPPDPANDGAQGPSAVTLLEQADRARAEGHYADAARALEELVARHPRDGRARSALFVLGRVRRTLGEHVEAAEAFRSYRERSPEGPLAEDALAEEAAAWAAAGERDRARRAAREYLERFPDGVHIVRVQRLAR